MANTSFARSVDELTLARARRGDRRAMEEIYRIFSQPVYSLALRICASPADAEDVLQETFLKLFQKLHQFRADAPFWGWVRKIAVNTALTRLKQGEMSAWELDELTAWKGASSGTTDRVDPSDAIDLEKKLARLPPLTRSVLWLHTVEGYTHAEIAELMGRTESFSKSQLSRAYDKLRKWLQWNNTTVADIQKRRRC